MMNEEFSYYKAVLLQLKTGQPVDTALECEKIKEYAASLKTGLRAMMIVDPQTTFCRIAELKTGCLYHLVKAMGQFEDLQYPDITDPAFSDSVFKNAAYLLLIQELEQLFVFLITLPELKDSQL